MVPPKAEMSPTTRSPKTLDGRPLPGHDVKRLSQLATRLRRDVLEMTYRAGSGHPGGSMSELETLLTLYQGGIMRFAPGAPHHPERDYFILSKGHACPGLYAVLADVGFFPRDELWRLRRLDGLLQGHSDRKIPGIEMSAGSLGMGLGFGNGIALALRQEGRDNHVYVMVGDGECQEGQVWEAAMTSAHRGLDNVTCILDHNKIQIDGFVEDVKRIEPIADKWASFGWHVIPVDGHDFDALFAAFAEARRTKGRPSVLIADTVKGKGVSFMEAVAEYHGRALNKDEMPRAMKELGATWSHDTVGWKEATA